jgi:FlaA1/EpsC-like NDP-sugar epimerase
VAAYPSTIRSRRSFCRDARRARSDLSERPEKKRPARTLVQCTTERMSRIHQETRMKQLVIVAHSSFVIETIRLTLRREPWLVSTAFVLAGRIWLISSERRVGRKGEAGQRALIVGAGNVGRWWRRGSSSTRRWELTPIGFPTRSRRTPARQPAFPSAQARISTACP